MKVLHDKIFVKITKENRESIYTKEILRNDGQKVLLWKTVPALDEIDERLSSLFVQSGVVSAVGENVDWIKEGDIALLNYDVCNSRERLVSKDDTGSTYYLEVTTTYHKDEMVAYQTRNSRRDQIVHSKGDYDYLSSLLGILRGNELIPNTPYIFFANEPNTISLVSASGILYSEKQKILRRTVLAISQDSSERFNIKKGDEILVDDYDIFSVKLDETHFIDCVNDMDVLCIIN